LGKNQNENLINKDKVYLIDFGLLRIIDNNDTDIVKAIMCEDKNIYYNLSKKNYKGQSKIYGKKKS